MAQALEALAALTVDPDTTLTVVAGFPAPTWQLTTVYTPFSVDLIFSSDLLGYC